MSLLHTNALLLSLVICRRTCAQQQRQQQIQLHHVHVLTTLFKRLHSCTKHTQVTTTNVYDIYHLSDVSGGAPYPLMTVQTTLKELLQFLPYTTTTAIDNAATATANSSATVQLVGTPNEHRITWAQR
jgi:hypothetical protein